ncbi:MAG TPA: hypothetical protein VLF69_02465 [Candidatus Saccharimonadales bacterium]|nr:hypothetical protein [Candidatus Saccharimonadales bacterium]
MNVLKKTIQVRVTALWLLGVAVVVVVGFTVWFAFHSVQLADTALKNANAASKDVPKLPAQVSSFEACQKSSGSTILQTYPAQCITKTGKKFTEPLTAVFLTINEWHVRIPLGASDLSDAEYSMSSDGTQAHITTKTLAALANKIGGCHPGIDDVYLERSSTTGDFPDTWTPRKIGSYYYGPAAISEPLCLSQGGDAKDLATIHTTQANLQQAVSQVVAAP